MLSNHERNALRELERQFPTRTALVFRAPLMGRRRTRLADSLALMTALVAHGTLLAAGSLGGALQPATLTGPESEAITRIRQLFADASL